ncbi:MAG: DsrE/DsrF/DrsH-like family protein, partial [Elusimicrobia bacterium]|nr:DsrE/DsrF/DrsH-like family protein [Elusimicrobiota bacterium]
KELVSLHPFTKALNFPFSNIWSDIDNIPKDRPIYIFCHSGEISREITKILTDRGYDATDIEGGYQAISKMLLQNPVHIDLKGKKCPGIIIQTAEAIDAIFDGQHLIVEATEEAFVSDIAIWCEKTGNKLISIYTDSKIIHAEIEKKSFSKEQKLEMFKEKNDKTFIVFSSDLDKVISAFILANGAIAMGRKVSMFFTFWGLSILRKTKKVSVEKSFIEKLFSFMLPRGTKGLKLSKMNMGGFGAKMIRRVMEEKGVDSLEELVQNAISHGARIVACQTTMYMMGIHKEELIDGIELGGVSSFLGAAENSDTNLFI